MLSEVLKHPPNTLLHFSLTLCVQVIANDLQSFDRQYLSEDWALTGASQDVFLSALTNNSLEGKLAAIGRNVR